MHVCSAKQPVACFESFESSAVCRTRAHLSNRHFRHKLLVLLYTDDDEDDEPLLSGSGDVQKECTEEELGSWAELINKWKDVTLRPRQLPGLVRKVGLFFESEIR